MSQMSLYTHDGKEFKLNVTQFRSPMNASINSVQTKTMLQHFPIRCGQPDISFTVRYASLDDKHAFESFVHVHQQDTRKYTQTDAYDVTLWWPERNIENWTGYITNYTVVEKRFETAPAATFGVALVESMMSEKTTIATRGFDVAKILGIQIPTYRGVEDTILIPPSPPQTARPVNPDAPPPFQPPLNDPDGTFTP